MPKRPLSCTNDPEIEALSPVTRTPVSAFGPATTSLTTAPSPSLIPTENPLTVMSLIKTPDTFEESRPTMSAPPPSRIVTPGPAPTSDCPATSVTVLSNVYTPAPSWNVVPGP